MSTDPTPLAAGDIVRHRDAPEDGPTGTITGVVNQTADGRPIYGVAFRSATGAKTVTRYPEASLVLVRRAEG